MKRHALVLTFLAMFATDAGANGITGNVLKSNGQPVWPCTIDIVDRTTGQPVVVPGESTLVTGHYNLVLPDGRYNLTFTPKLGTHVFTGLFNDARVQANTVTVNMTLALGQYFKGKVVSTTGVGVGLTDIRFKDAAGNLATTQDNGTNADGTFNTLVVPGLYTAEIIPALTQHKAPVQMLNQNLTVDVNPGNVVVQDGWVLTCTVTDPSQFPLALARIAIRTQATNAKAFLPANNTATTGVAQVVVPAGIYDVCAEPPPSLETTYGTRTQYGVNVTADATLPNFALQPGKPVTGHVVGGSPLAPVVNADLDVRQELSPTFPFVETLNDFTDGLGNFTQTLVPGSYRVTVRPAVTTKLIPVRVDNVTVGAAGVNLGTLTCQTGHWVNVNVVAQGTGVPIAGGNIDLFNLQTGLRLITLDDVTGPTGSTTIVTDQQAYRFQVEPPSAAYDTAYVIGVFRTLNDTTITIVMPRKGVLGVEPPHAGALQLAAPWPNPARGGVHFSFAGEGKGELSIVDVTGRRVATPWQGTIAGAASAGWEARDDAGHAVSSGVYFAILRVDGRRSVRRIVVAN